MTRRKLLIGFGAASAIGAVDIFAIEPRWPKLVTERVPILGKRPNKPIRLVQLSDLHLSESVSPSMIRHAFEQALDAKPDLICLTGDYITRAIGTSLEGYSDLFRILASRVPTFAVKGNHDGGYWARTALNDYAENEIDEQLLKAEVRLLRNQSAAVRMHGTEFWLAGMTDLWNRDMDPAAAYRAIPKGEPVILLAHNPDSKDELTHVPWKLMLSGHTHGAQNGLPYLKTRYAPVVDKRFIHGLGLWSDAPGEPRYLNVNPGIGNLRGFRILCRPEISVLEIV
jgi:hypothetical protein